MPLVSLSNVRKRYGDKATGRVALDEFSLSIDPGELVAIIGTSGSAEKLEKLRPLGLDLALATRKPDFAPAVMKATGERGADLAINAVGGSVFGECVRALGFEGRLAFVGYVDGVLKAEMDLEEAAALMVRHRIRRLPVTDRGRLAGIVTLDDIAVRTGNLEVAERMTADVIEGALPGFFFHERG